MLPKYGNISTGFLFSHTQMRQVSCLLRCPKSWDGPEAVAKGLFFNFILYTWGWALGKGTWSL